MKYPFVPDVSLYTSLITFLNDFYTLNKEKNKNFSYRYLAMKISWSAPYLNDVLKGRKKLSFHRALEFINYLGLRGANAERFLFLYLAESDNSFHNSSLKNEALAIRNTRNTPSTVTVDTFHKWNNVFEHYILYYIAYQRGVWNPQDFLARLTLTSKPSLESLQESIERMLVNGYLVHDPKTNLYEARQPDLFLVEQKGKTETEVEKMKLEFVNNQDRQYALNYLNYTQNPIHGKRSAFSGTINLDEELYKEAQDRMLALRNYLLELGKKAEERFEEAQGPNGRAWQFSINLFSLFEQQ